MNRCRELAPLSPGNFTLAVALAVAALAVFCPSASARDFGQITGKVTTNSGAPISFGDVVLEGTNHGSMTDANGEYLIKNVPPGTYDLRVRYLGYVPAIISLQVESHRTITMDLVLDEVPDRASPTQRGVPVGEILPLLSTASKVQSFRVPRGTSDLDSAVPGPVLSRNQIRFLKWLLLGKDGRFIGGRWAVESRRCLWRPMLAFSFATGKDEGLIEVNLSCMTYRMHAGGVNEVGNLRLETRQRFAGFALRLFPGDPGLKDLGNYGESAESQDSRVHWRNRP